MTLPRMNSPNIQGDIRVIQHNCARSSNCMYSLLDTTKDLADIILIQEPWINQRDRTTIKAQGYTSIIPSQGERPRVLAFISNLRKDFQVTSRPDYTQDPDIQALTIKYSTQEEILLLNIYNEKPTQGDQTTYTVERTLVDLNLKRNSIICGTLMHIMNFGTQG